LIAHGVRVWVFRLVFKCTWLSSFWNFFLHYLIVAQLAMPILLDWTSRVVCEFQWCLLLRL
jgi:hypothetical protein